MNHSNLKIIVDSRLKHPYGVHHRLQFFAHTANVKLVVISRREDRQVTYAIKG